MLLLDRATFPRDKTCGDGLTPRAIAALGRLGVLPDLTAAGYRVIHGACLVAPDSRQWHLRFAEHVFEVPPYGLVVPRVELDDRLRRHALSHGARFRGGVSVTQPLWEGNRVIGVKGQESDRTLTVRARLVILATGASIGLLRALAVLERMPSGVNAVRVYFSDIPGLIDEFEFYFDSALSPGYAWVFPLADGRANVGLGVPSHHNAGRDLNTRRLLLDFVARQPRLRAARLHGPLKGYPLRIDFPRCRPVGQGFMLVGEALGLVNPVTGEGIDLALESAELAAVAADRALRKADSTLQGLAPYARSLRARYGAFFLGVHLLFRLATGPQALNLLIRKGSNKPFLGRMIAGINLGLTSPWMAFSPRTWWDILM